MSKSTLEMILFSKTHYWLWKSAVACNSLFQKAWDAPTPFEYPITIWFFAEKIKTFIAVRRLPVTVHIHINTCRLQLGLTSTPVRVPHSPFIGPSVLIIGLRKWKPPWAFSLTSHRQHEENKQGMCMILKPVIWHRTLNIIKFSKIMPFLPTQIYIKKILS